MRALRVWMRQAGRLLRLGIDGGDVFALGGLEFFGVLAFVVDDEGSAPAVFGGVGV